VLVFRSRLVTKPELLLLDEPSMGLASLRDDPRVAGAYLGRAALSKAAEGTPA